MNMMMMMIMMMKSNIYCCQILVKLAISRQTFEEYSNVKFHENSFRGIRVVSCGRTDKHAEANCLFPKFYERARKWKGTFYPETDLHKAHMPLLDC